jgi:putative ABC transport system permease protein
MSTLWFEFTLALRRLFRRKTQNGLLLVTFAVSLGLSLLSWSLFHTIFLSRPEFDPQGRVYLLTCAGSFIVDGRHASRDEIAAYQEANTVFDEFAPAELYGSVSIRTPTGTERYLGAYLSARALQIAGAQPILGRLFAPADDQRGAATVALISQRMWANDYGSDPQIVGRTVEANGDPVTIVGVLPASFRFPNDQDLWLSYGDAPDPPRYQVNQALVKLKPGVTRERAERDVQQILARLGPESPCNKFGRRPALRPVRDLFLMPEIRVSAVILFSLAMIFVLVSCANAANLMLIDFLGRRSEVAAALALGVPRGAAIRAVCFQVGTIAVGAALLGLAFLAAAGPWLYDRIKILNAPYWLSYHFSWTDVAVAFALAAVSAAVTSIAPVVYLWWVDPDQVIREHAYASRGTGRALWRRLLLTAQIALLTVLGVSAGLLVRSSYHVGESQWGYPADRVFMGKMTNFFLGDDDPQTDQRRLTLHRKALAEVEQRPATVAAALASNPPGYSNGPYCTYALDPAEFAQHAARGEAFSSRVTERYFETLAVPVVAGKMFPAENPADGPTSAVINESLARKLWPGQDALQRALFIRFAWMKETDEPFRVIVCGVVRDFQANGPTARSNDAIFTPFTMKYGAPGGIFLFVRDQAGVPPVRSLREAVHRADPRIMLYFPDTIAGQIGLMLSSVRMTTDLTTVFALAALVLGAIGVYSLTVAQVLQSSREFGIRMALGAEPRQLWQHFTRGHLAAALIGVAFGLVGATQVVRVLGSLLYGVNPHSVATYAGVALAILGVATLACVPSLFRLKKINPAECLRSL